MVKSKYVYLKKKSVGGRKIGTPTDFCPPTPLLPLYPPQPLSTHPPNPPRFLNLCLIPLPAGHWDETILIVATGRPEISQNLSEIPQNTERVILFGSILSQYSYRNLNSASALFYVSFTAGGRGTLEFSRLTVL